MTTSIPAVQGTASIRDFEAVSLTVTFTNGTTKTTRSLYFSTSYKAETIAGNSYSQLGGLMAISAQQRDLSATSYDTNVSITGIDPLYIYFIAGSPATAPIPIPGQADIGVGYYPVIKGSEIKIYRGFYNANFVLTSTVLRYTGIVTSYSITEERDNSFEALNDTYTIALNCSAIKRLLESRIAGRKTNPASWQKLGLSTDTSMSRVPGLQNKLFDFGKPVATGGGGQVFDGTDLTDTTNRRIDNINEF